MPRHDNSSPMRTREQPDATDLGCKGNGRKLNAHMGSLIEARSAFDSSFNPR